MIFRQITHDDLGCASYLIGDEDAGVAAVVDPKLEIEEYLALARYMGVRIEHILETHNHADHVSGHGRLAAATGATIHVNRLAAPDYATAFDYVAQGLGVTVLPRLGAFRLPAEVRAVTVSDAAVRRRIMLRTKRSMRTHPAVARAAELVREAAAERDART